MVQIIICKSEKRTNDELSDWIGVSMLLTVNIMMVIQ